MYGSRARKCQKLSAGTRQLNSMGKFMSPADTMMLQLKIIRMGFIAMIQTPICGSKNRI